MYKINPGEARTDLYGINKGEAQVFDTSQTERAALLAQRQQADAAKLKQKEENKRLDDISTQLGAMSSVAYMPRDRELIAGKTQGVKDYVLKNVDKLMKGDPSSMIEFQNLYGDLKSTAEQSKNAREQWEQQGNKIAANPDLYRPEATDYHLNFASKGQAGNFAYDTTQLKHNVDYGKHVLSELLPATQKMAKQNGYDTDFTADQAKQLIADDLTDPVKFEQVGYDFNKAKPEELTKLGNPKTPIEYAQAKYAPQLVVRDRKPIPASESKTAEDKLPKVAGVLTKEKDGKGDFQFEYTNAQDNPYLTIQDPEGKKTNTVIADERAKEFASDSKYDPSLNPEHAKKNRDAYDDELKRKGFSDEDLSGNRNGGAAIEVKPLRIVYDGKNTHMIALTKPGKDENSVDVPGREITIPFAQASEIMANKFGIKNIYDIKNGNAPKHVTVKEYENSSAPAEKKHSIKGREYSQSAVEKAAKASGMSVDEYLKEIGK